MRRKLTAYHEAGHAIAMHALPTHDPVHQITIVPRGHGWRYDHLPAPGGSLLSRSRNEMFEDIVALLGGRVAEEQFLGDISTGASNDLERATAIARAMVAKYGMSDALGAVAYDDGKGEVFIGRLYGTDQALLRGTIAASDRPGGESADRQGLRSVPNDPVGLRPPAGDHRTVPAGT